MPESSGRQRFGEKNQPGLADRLLMAAIAPLAFNISIIIVIAMLFRRSGYWARHLLYPTDIPGGRLIFLVTIAAPAIAGFLMGSRRFATLFGHFFFTNMDHEKNIALTTALWAGLIGCAYWLS